MNQGKHVLLTIEEFLYRISAYLEVDVNLVNQNCYLGDNVLYDSEDDIVKENIFKLEIPNKNMKNKDISDLVKKIVGDKNNTAIINRAKREMEKDNKMSFNMKECTDMFAVIFDIHLLKTFYKHVIIDEDIIYLFFETGILGEIIHLYQYKCECGEAFGVENRQHREPNSYIKYCPYCGANLEDNIENLFLAKYYYVVSEIE